MSSDRPASFLPGSVADDALCVSQDGRAAATTCLRCGAFLCLECRHDEATGVCLSCLERLLESLAVELNRRDLRRAVLRSLLVPPGLALALFVAVLATKGLAGLRTAGAGALAVLLIFGALFAGVIVAEALASDNDGPGRVAAENLREFLRLGKAVELETEEARSARSLLAGARRELRERPTDDPAERLRFLHELIRGK